MLDKASLTSLQSEALSVRTGSFDSLSNSTQRSLGGSVLDLAPSREFVPGYGKGRVEDRVKEEREYCEHAPWAVNKQRARRGGGPPRGNQERKGPWQGGAAPPEPRKPRARPPRPRRGGSRP